MNQKIAIPTDDGVKISRHFGSARYFHIVTWQDAAQAWQVEMREKPGHHDHDHDHSHFHGEGHHGGQGAGNKFALLHDCQVLIGAGMGQPAYDRLQQMGVEVILTGEKLIAPALEKYQQGVLANDMRRVHAHHHHDHEHTHEQRQNVQFID